VASVSIVAIATDPTKVSTGSVKRQKFLILVPGTRYILLGVL
jgi:hypothetical protein